MSLTTLERATIPGDDTLLPVLDVGIDVDGIYYLFDKAWHTAMLKLGWIPAGDPFTAGRHQYHPAQRWEFYEDYGFTLDTFLASCDLAADMGLLWAQDPIPGSTHAWRELARAGHRLHVITDRTFGSAAPQASTVATRMWLYVHDLPYDTLTFTADKTRVPVDIMLEDKTENYDALDQAGVEVWLLDRAWNQDDGTRRRVFSHDEYLVRVEAARRRRAASA